jgi:CheY-like chemotaxis protein
VDPTQLEQIIVNLAVNGSAAMPGGGTLTITVKDAEPADPDRPDHDLTAGPFVRISITDTGTGMDQATLARIFDPFFTTKGQGRGTGLGLSTVFGIVAQSGGQLNVETAPGKGSTFHVDLPRVDPLAAPECPPAGEAVEHRAGVVLLAEDDAAIREFARRSLEATGYTVLAAPNGEDALEASERWPEGIDVLVTDLMMPGVHGPELAARITKTRPRMGVVFISGYAEDAVDYGEELAAAGEFLPKPFTVSGLADAVDRAARSSRRSGLGEMPLIPAALRWIPRPSART